MKCLNKLRFFICIIIGVIFYLPSEAQVFSHPGLLQNAGDLERMKTAVANKQEPIYSGFLIFQSNPQSQYTYQMKGPMVMVGRNPTVGQTTYDTDAAAAYQNAIMWAITGKIEYAQKSEEIINAWSNTLKSITGRDAVLMAGLGPFKMVNAAEILRYTNAGWSVTDIQKTEQHFMEVIYPVIKNYALFANGNWDTAAIKTAMAIAVFCNNRPIFEDALRYYADGAGNGRISNYIINEAGQCQESGRDQQHTQLGIAHLADCSEIAWHQGLDLYGFDNNLLLKGFEYTAKYNLGLDVTYKPVIDKTGKYFNKIISEEGRGKFRTVYEQVYNHYVNRVGIPAPYTQQVAEKIRPEQQGSGGDNVGFGTLLYSLPSYASVNTKPMKKPVAPAGLIAKTSAVKGNIIMWIQPIDAESYTVKRSLLKSGPYLIIASGIKFPIYEDHNIIKGTNYYYTVSSKNKAGKSTDAYPVGITSTLPLGWKFLGLDSVKRGYATYDGKTFTIQGEGMTVDSMNDQIQFLCRSLKGNGTIIARYVPQISSQLTSFGFTMREAPTGNSASVSLVLGPEPSKQIEAPHWNLKLLARGKTGANALTKAEIAMQSEPIVTFSRLTGYCWLKLQRRDDEFYGYYSTDGKSWTTIGTFHCSLKKQLYVGLSVNSGVSSLATSVNFDNVSISESQDK